MRAAALLAVAATVAVVALAGCAGSEQDDRAAADGVVSTPRASSAPTATAPPASSAADPEASTSPPSSDPVPNPAPQGDGSSAPDETSLVAPASLVPGPGRYVYATSGFSESGAGPTAQRRDAPAETIDTITVTAGNGGTNVRVVTSSPDGEQESRFLMTDSEAHLRQLVSRSRTAGVSNDLVVTPDPPVLVARLPYRDGDTWENTWRDDELGLQGTGTGTVLGREAVDAPWGRVDAVVIRIVQRIRGSITGELTVTAWVDPATAVQVKQHSVSDIQGPTGASYSEVTRILRGGPQ